MRPPPIARFSLAATAVVLGWAVLSFQTGAADQPAPSDTTHADSSDTAFPPGNAKKGKRVFSAKGCVACHKTNGSGGIKFGGNPTPDWRNAERMNDPQFNDAYLRDCIINGKAESGMVPWKGTLKPAQVEDLIAYIHTFEKKTKKKKK